jgi:hypothetical protein
MNKKDSKLDLILGHRHLVIQGRYDALGAVNDLLIALWFLIGSFFFLTHSLQEDGTWLFIAGSAQLLIKPSLKLASLIHLKKIRSKYTRDRNQP